MTGKLTHMEKVSEKSTYVRQEFVRSMQKKTISERSFFLFSFLLRKLFFPLKYVFIDNELPSTKCIIIIIHHPHRHTIVKLLNIPRQKKKILTLLIINTSDNKSILPGNTLNARTQHNIIYKVLREIILTSKPSFIGYINCTPYTYSKVKALKDELQQPEK